MTDFGWDEAPKFRLRGNQGVWLDKIDADLRVFPRQLVVAPGGLGKTTMFGALADRFAARGIRTLVLANRDRLVEQTANRIRSETGREVAIERADDHADPYSPIVVASVQTLGRVNRLTGFADNHFGLVVPDEAHLLTLAPQPQRVLRYFHYGAESLAEDWKPPEDGKYTPHCLIAGFTATPDIGPKRSLKEFYAHPWSVSYSYREAVEDGWLVAPIQKCIPVKLDLRKLRTGRTEHGTDYRADELSAAMIPIVEELAEQILKEAHDRKTIAFLPSVECARMLDAAINRRGMKGIFVSGECLDVDEKTEDFVASGPGTVLSNAVLYTYGVDFPDVDCIAWFRATLSKAFYIQGIYRGTRVLPGVIDGILTAEERCAAIAASKKPSLLILDPLFVSDRIDLCDAYDLYAVSPEAKEAMKKKGGLTLESAEEAERDFIKALEKAAKKVARRDARTINPLAWAVSLGQDKLAAYTPETSLEAGPIHPEQIAFLAKNKIDASKLTCYGQAAKVISTFLVRLDAGLATPGQLDFLAKLGVPAEKAALMKAGQAGAVIQRLKRERGWA